ncbi:MAG TPA: BTAD domain-containing putative transcriptional regulator [Chloroflexia bacterium]|nr:BTAD domain-containing putative transcriptional regulator [Chloroflexia bacterium]
MSGTVLEVGGKSDMTDPTSPAQLLAQATAEYQKLAASLMALNTQLAAMGIAVEPYPASHPNTQVHQSPPAPLLPGVTHSQPGTDAAICVRMLGPFQLEVKGRKFGPGVPGQVRTVLEYLISQGRRPTPKDALLDLLWPDANPSVAYSRLRVVMHTLRKSIPCKELGLDDLVISSGNNFMLNPQASLWVDVVEFERHWQNGWRYTRAGETQQAIYEYEQAEALYIGDYLEDEPYADWTLLRREALRDAYASILTLLAGMSLEAGDYTGCIIWAQKLLAQDNCREDAYRLLIISHKRLGQASRAAYWYKLCALALQRELGMEPSSETEAVFKRP